LNLFLILDNLTKIIDKRSMLLAGPRRSPMPRRPQRPDRYRLGMRLGAGVAPARAAAAEGIAEAEVDALLRDPDFAALVEDCRRHQDLPEEERLARLEGAAWTVLELAVADGDMRAVLFVLAERRHGRNPARTLARRVDAAARRAATTTAPAPAAATDAAAPPPAAPSPRRPRPAADPAVRSVARGAARLRPAVLAELALRPASTPAPAAAPARRPLRHRHHADRLGCATAVAALAGGRPAGPRAPAPFREALAAYLAQAP
jgi:hypothetical protein